MTATIAFDMLLCFAEVDGASAALPYTPLPSIDALLSLATRPFLAPAPIDRYWLWFLPPLIVVIAVVYRTIKTETLEGLPRRAGYLAFQISVFMVLAAAALWLTLLFF
jgi:hypothetical protein